MYCLAKRRIVVQPKALPEPVKWVHVCIHVFYLGLNGSCNMLSHKVSRIQSNTRSIRSRPWPRFTFHTKLEPQNHSTCFRVRQAESRFLLNNIYLYGRTREIPDGSFQHSLWLVISVYSIDNHFWLDKHPQPCGTCTRLYSWANTRVMNLNLVLPGGGERGGTPL